MNVKSKITTLAILAAANCAAREAQRKVTVCVSDFSLATKLDEVVEAREIASDMFAAIGVKLDWRFCPKSGGQGTIVISLNMDTPANRKPGELAHTSPYEGTHIVIFYDCVRKIRPKKFSVVLAHVMVHEVTHILQGICRHSASGVMKARWEDYDFLQMACKPLPFTDADIDLIRLGLDAREARDISSNPINRFVIPHLRRATRQ
jgi:hypothetical protein